MKTIIFYGALGYKNRFVVGGGESGNLRTINLMEKMGFRVLKLYKPYPAKGLPGGIKYGFMLFWKVFVLLKVLLDNKDAKHVHVSGFYKHLIYQEYLLVLVSKLFSRKVTYELRGGGVEESFVKGGIVYRFLFQKTVSASDYLLVQGKRYECFLRKLSKKHIAHFPNFINEIEFSKPNSASFTNSVIRLVYFGRIAESKNVDLVIDVCDELNKQGYKATLDIIGSGSSYQERYLKDKVRSQNLDENVNFVHEKFGRELYSLLGNYHFFIFPSSEPREGHSNALNEAMAMGVIPVCSNVGFNADVVPSSQFIVSDYLPSSYAKIICSVWESGKWNELSDHVRKYAFDSFSSSSVIEIIKQIYF